MGYEYVEWVSKSPVLWSRLNQMSENIEYVKTLEDTSPKGVIAWSKKLDDFTLAGTDTGTWKTITDLTFDATVGSSRMIKATYKCRGIYGGDAENSRTISTRILIDDESSFGVVQFMVSQEHLHPFPQIVHIGALGEGEHNFKVQAQIVTGTATNVELRASGGGPHLLIIEDIGPYVADS